MLKEKYIKDLERVFDDAPVLKIVNGDKYVVFSDIHIGNGGSQDDFLQNAELFSYILENYYLPNDYTLVLNGDIEELYKFRLRDIIKRWKKMYLIFEKFKEKNSLYKIVGNHDHELNLRKSPEVNKDLYEAIRLDYKENSIFIFHGHQTANYLETYNKFSRFLVRYIVNGLRIKNPTMTVDSKKISDTEVRAYEFSCMKKIISIIGHTHKPLFESMSRRDTINYMLENLIRKYSFADEKKKKKIEKNIRKLKSELTTLAESKPVNIRASVFSDGLLVPSLFNSGAVIGKRGSTGIEIANGKISLIYWFDINRSKRYVKYKGVETINLENTHYYKAVLKKDSLDYIFSKIKLLA